MNLKYDFQGQTALVTGAASGIGRATVKAFAESGAAVVLVDRDEEKLNLLSREITQAGDKAIPVAGDVSEEQGEDRGRTGRTRVRQP